MTKKSLAETHPEIAKQWHPTKNGKLTPYDVTPGSNKKVWWKCPKGDDHIYEAYIKLRSRGSGCPICSGRKVVKSNSLATTHPQLAKEWHPTKNGILTPYNFSYGSKKKVWWKCPKGDDHEYVMNLNARTNSSKPQNCPICSGRKVVKSNSLATLNPEIVKYWHPTKNGKLTPNDVTYQSGKKVWWKCPKGDDHEFLGLISDRKKGLRCPYCSKVKISTSQKLDITHPHLAKEWYYPRNGKLKPNDIHVGYSRRIWWKCSVANDHIWKTRPIDRKTQGCPFCANQKVSISNCLQTRDSKLSKEWHPTKNGNLNPKNVIAGSPVKIWWICKNDKNHIWKAKLSDRFTSKAGCPMCAEYGFNLNKKGYLYLHLIYHKSGKNIGLKFGITNKYGIRIKDLERGLNIYKIKNIFYFEGDGKIVNDIEKNLKRNYKTGYINKEIMRFGYSETVKYSDKIIVEIYNLCNKKLKFKSGKKLYMKRLLNIFN